MAKQTKSKKAWLLISSTGSKEDRVKYYKDYKKYKEKNRDFRDNWSCGKTAKIQKGERNVSH